MSILRSRPFRAYVVGLFAVVAGAGLSHRFDSMLPLAMGAALALIETAGLVREIRAGAALERERARRDRGG